MQRIIKRSLIFIIGSVLMIAFAGSVQAASFMDYFKASPIIEPLSSSCWGASEVGPRDQANGLEDRTMTKYCYWDGGIIKGADGKYHMFASRWDQSAGHNGWFGSVAVHATSANLYGPYTDKGMCWPSDLGGKGHNVFPLVLKDGRYAVLVSETRRPADIFVSNSLDGPWSKLGSVSIAQNAYSSLFTASNVCIMLRPDGKYATIGRDAVIGIADNVLGPYTIQGTNIFAKIPGCPTGNMEDPVMWFSGGLYHIVVNKWDTRKAYHLTSKDGINDWKLDTGYAFDPTVNFIRYTNGTANYWNKLERPNVYIEDGHVVAMTLSAIDVAKDKDGGYDKHGSKVIVIPFDGAKLDGVTPTPTVTPSPTTSQSPTTPTPTRTVCAWQPDNGNGTFNNPIMYADYPDPSMIRVGNYFYLATSTFANVPGLVISKSEDMVNWEVAGHCIESFSGSAYNMQGGLKYGNGCFAPSIAYKDGTFYVVVTPNGERTIIFSAKDVAGPWKSTTLNGSYFDPALFIESDGTPYLVSGGAWQNKINMIQLNSDLTGTVGSEKVILSYNNVEGAHLVKAKGKYYLFNAVPAQRLVCSRANNVWGPYGETTTLCVAGKGGHQGGIVDLPDGSYWGYLQQDDGGIGRMTRICPITWQNEWPMFGNPGKTGQVEASYTKPIQDKPIKVPETSDEFNSNTLGLQWMWNHNPDNTKWSLTGSALRLKAASGSDFWNARNSLIQKGQGPVSSGTIKVDCTNMQPGDICGLGMLGDPRGYIAVTGNPKRIIMSEEESIKASVNNITSNILYFRIEMNFTNRQAKFFWKDESSNWQPLGTTLSMGFDIMGTFQGEQYAILNYNPSGSTGYVDVDWFRLNDIPGPDGELSPTPTNDVIYGDVNGDKIVDSADYTILRQYLIRKITAFPDKNGSLAADVSGDGRIDSADFTYIRKFLLRIITSFPAVK